MSVEVELTKINFGIATVSNKKLHIIKHRVTIARRREPWSSGYGRSLTSKKWWVQFPAPVTGWTFFSQYIVVKNIVMFVFKDLK